MLEYKHKRWGWVEVGKKYGGRIFDKENVGGGGKERKLEKSKRGGEREGKREIMPNI